MNLQMKSKMLRVICKEHIDIKWEEAELSFKTLRGKKKRKKKLIHPQIINTERSVKSKQKQLIQMEQNLNNEGVSM